MNWRTILVCIVMSPIFIWWFLLNPVDFIRTMTDADEKDREKEIARKEKMNADYAREQARIAKTRA